ncbi:MAG: hypothetical protein SFV22_18395, partial [Saprospiraceae bacterium]|nr:hypothetical protein [Saprospiraceae bacterium]
RTEKASFGTCSSGLFRAIWPDIPLKSTFARNPKPALVCLASIFQTHPNSQITFVRDFSIIQKIVYRTLQPFFQQYEKTNLGSLALFSFFYFHH